MDLYRTTGRGTGKRTAPSRFVCSLFSDRRALETAESAFDQRLLLLVVLRVVADCRRGRSRTAAVRQLLPVLHAFLQMVLDVEPRALILRLVLHPHHFGRVV